MLVELAVEPHHRVLEIGTGSGYMSAVLGRLGRDVFSIERFRTLALAAAERLGALEHAATCALPTGDGLAIWPQIGPFDRILLNGTVPEVPAALIDALADRRRLVGRAAHRRRGAAVARRAHGEGILSRGASRAAQAAAAGDRGPRGRFEAPADPVASRPLANACLT